MNKLSSFPPLLLTAILLFWGWQSHLLAFAIPMAFILESPRWIKWRWQLSDKEINRIADFTSLLLVFSLFYLFNQQGSQGIFTLLNWLPILFFLLIFIQSYDIQSSFKLSVLFVTLRTNKQGIIENQRVDLRYPYILICLLSTSVGHNEWFFLGSYLLIIWGLWLIRPRRYPIYVWLSLIVSFGIAAYWGQMGIYQLQIKTEQWVISWLEEFLSISRDPYRQHTALGEIGTLKQSDKIIWRVQTKQPLLLREATYNTYFNETWYAKQSHFTPLAAQSDQTTWLLAADFKLPEHHEQLQVIGYLSQGKGLLPLSMGSYQVKNLAAINVQRNQFGTIKISEGAEFIDYLIEKNTETPLDTPPTAQDLVVPAQEQAHLQTLITQLQLMKLTPQQAIQRLNQFFNQQFSYSLTLPTPTDHSTPLQYFLQQARYGHCEYFATATALLLRQAHIPSRYTVGYAVDEYSNWEDSYIVRRRHAHAWTLAFIDGRWQEIDNTPIVWKAWEDEQASHWQLLSDIGSWLALRFTQWRWQESEETKQWFLVIIPLILILFWRLYLKKRIRPQQHKESNFSDKTLFAGIDSPFYQIVQQLTLVGYERLTSETLTIWLQRTKIAHCLPLNEMKNLLQLHQRYRFDPQGINQEELELLRLLVQKWLNQFKKRVL